MDWRSWCVVVMVALSGGVVEAAEQGSAPAGQVAQKECHDMDPWALMRKWEDRAPQVWDRMAVLTLVALTPASALVVGAGELGAAGAATLVLAVPSFYAVMFLNHSIYNHWHTVPTQNGLGLTQRNAWNLWAAHVLGGTALLGVASGLVVLSILALVAGIGLAGVLHVLT